MVAVNGELWLAWRHQHVVCLGKWKVDRGGNGRGEGEAKETDSDGRGYSDEHADEDLHPEIS